MIGDAEKVSENAYLSASVSIETSLMATIQQTLSVNHSLSYFPYSSLHIFFSNVSEVCLECDVLPNEEHLGGLALYSHAV